MCEAKDDKTEEIQKKWNPVLKLKIGGEHAFIGPGCWELLSLIEKNGSVRLACEEMQLSYSKAWKILNRLEAQAGHKVLIRRHGGKNGGETRLTQEGRELLARYEAFVKESNEAVRGIFEKYFG